MAQTDLPGEWHLTGLGRTVEGGFGTAPQRSYEALIARPGDPQEVEFVTPNWGGFFLVYAMQGRASHCFDLCLKSHFLNHTNVPIPNSRFQPPNQPNSKNEAKFRHSFEIGRYHPFFMHFFTHETRNFATPSLFDELVPLMCICICVC